MTPPAAPALPPVALPSAADLAQFQEELSARMVDAEKRVQIETRILEAAMRLGTIREGSRHVRKQRKEVLQEAQSQLFKAEVALASVRRQFFRHTKNTR
jgi:hypothetical protein